MSFPCLKSLTLAICLVLFITVLGISLYVGYGLTHPPRHVIDETPAQYGLLYENIEFASTPDAVKLKGWWIPAQADSTLTDSAKTIIFAHGYGTSRLFLQPQALLLAKTLAAAHYNVLLFDFRNSGESEGTLTSVGYFEKQDLLSAINYAVHEKKSQKIALMGWSMGAVVAINAGVESPEVTAIIADSAFANLQDYLQTNLNVWSGLPNFPFTPIILKTLTALNHIDITAVSPNHAITQMGERHILLIHSKSDPSTPFQNSVQLYDAAPNKANTELWLTAGADHIRTCVVYPQEYAEKILSFLASAF